MYIGKTPTVGNFQVCDAISVVNGQAAYTLQVGGVNVAPESANHMLVSLNGILQKPGSSFTISGSTMTFASNLATGDVIDFVQILGNVLDIGQPSDDTVTAAKLNDNVISGQTALTAEPDDTDEFLVSDAGTIKRIDYSLIKGGGITNAQSFYLSGSKSGSSGVGTVIDSAFTAFDSSAVNASVGTIGSASNVTVSSGVFSFASTGYYLILTQMNFYMGGSDSTRYVLATIEATYDNSSYGEVAQGATQISSVTSSNDNTSATPHVILNVDNTSNVKFRLKMQGVNTLVTETQSKGFKVTIIRLADV